MEDSSTPSTPRANNAFLLTQIGTHAAQVFATRLAALDLTPPQSGLLRAIHHDPGRSQQALAEHMGTPPTRLVALVDGLEQRRLVQRRRNPDDRRLYAVHLTDDGQALLRDIAKLAREHDDELLAALDSEERAHLHTLLARVAADRGLTPGVHPGYRTLTAADTHNPAPKPPPAEPER
ncbi:MarR family winged helix-turn-helix transcriptional regulator [Bounagaea algeriensis]